MKKIFTIAAVTLVTVLGANAQLSKVAAGVKLSGLSVSMDKAPFDTLVTLTADTCSDPNLYTIPLTGPGSAPGAAGTLFGTATMTNSPVAITTSEVAQKFGYAYSGKVLAVIGYIELIGSGNSSYMANVYAGGATPGTTLGTATGYQDTLVSGITFAIWTFTTPVDVSGDFFVGGPVTSPIVGDTINYFVIGCESNQSFVKAGGAWINTSTYGIGTDLAFTVFLDRTATNSIEESNITASNLMPNPAADFTVLAYNIKESSSVNIKVMNMTGQVVKQINEGSKQAGTYTSIIDVKDLAAGTYVYQITAGGASTTGRLVVAK
jgi:hypothetical protein